MKGTSINSIGFLVKLCTTPFTHLKVIDCTFAYHYSTQNVYKIDTVVREYGFFNLCNCVSEQKDDAALLSTTDIFSLIEFIIVI